MWKQLSKPLQVWSTTVRLRTVPIPTVQVFTGIGLAYIMTGKFNAVTALYTWLIGFFITIGTNLINEVIDFEKGGDPLNRFGHTKAIPAGLVDKNQVLAAGLAAIALAVICSIPLSIQSSWLVFFLVALSAVCAYCYTGGPYPICYHGLSELFVLVFYGGVCVAISYYVQAMEINRGVFLAAWQTGLLAIIPNALNNFRDMSEDVLVSKKTLAVRFGKYFARWEITLLTIAPFLSGLLWWPMGYPAAALLPFILCPLAYVFVRDLWITEPGKIFNRYFGISILLHVTFGGMLLLGFLLS